MINMQVIIWLFPIIFIFHDFEEIIFMEAWIKRNKSYLAEKFPKLFPKFSAHLDKITTSSFALGVAEEFMLINVITITAYFMEWYSLWLGSFIAFILHLLIHCVQTIIVRRYLPLIVTTIISLPVCLYIISQVIVMFDLSTVVLYSFIGFIIMIVNIIALHKYMDVFTVWINKYQQKVQ